MTSLTDNAPSSLPTGADGHLAVKIGERKLTENSEKYSDSGLSANFAQLLGENDPVVGTLQPSEEPVAEFTRSLTGEAQVSSLPANVTGNLSPAIGKSLPVSGKSSENPPHRSPSYIQPTLPSNTTIQQLIDPGARLLVDTAKPATGLGERTPDRDSFPIPTAALKAVQQLIEAGLGSKLQAETETATTLARPKQPSDSGKLPTSAVAIGVIPQLSRSISRDRLAAVTLQPEQVNAPSLLGSLETSVRPIMPVTSTDNISLSLQLSGQAAGSPAVPMHSSHSGQAAMGVYDFEAMVERLVEAREVAQANQTGRTQMAVRHHDFGQVSIRLESAAAGMKFALTNIDPDFAPAVHVALADRNVLDRAGTADLLSGSNQNENGRNGQPDNSAKPSANNGRDQADNVRNGAGDEHHREDRQDSRPRETDGRKGTASRASGLYA